MVAWQLVLWTRGAALLAAIVGLKFLLYVHASSRHSAAADRRRADGRWLAVGTCRVGAIEPSDIEVASRMPSTVSPCSEGARATAYEANGVEDRSLLDKMQGGQPDQIRMAVPEALTRFPQSILGLLPGLR